MLKVELTDSIAAVTLNRPDVHNAFNDELVRLLHEVFTDLAKRDDLRVIVLQGTGRSFCAGADLNWMKRVAEFSREQNIEDARRLAQMFLSIARCPKFVVARVHGTALGGGAGLVAACDMAIAVESAQFGFTEVKLGIIPAVISPFVIARMGSRAREYFLTGERFPAAIACQLGLVQHVVGDETALDSLIDEKVAQIATSAPSAVAAIKELFFATAERNLESSLELAADAIARARASEEGQAGMKAFLQHEKPPWQPQ
jgi:methylglutaconyl-CoA hydratase